MKEKKKEIKLVDNPIKIDYTDKEHECQWIPLVGKEGNTVISTFLFTCLKCGNLKVGRHTIKISRFRLDMDDKPIKNLGAPVETTDCARKADLDRYVGDNIDTQTGSYTLALTDEGHFFKFTNSSEETLTVPPNSSVPFDVGAEIKATRYGTGKINFVEGSGVTINSIDSKTAIDGQYMVVTLKKIATNEWVLVGSLSLLRVWSAAADLAAERDSLGGCGTQTAGLSFGGDNPVVATTEEYNGVAWSGGGDLATARTGLGGCGTQTAGLSFGGVTSGSTTAATEEYNGTAWSSGGPLITARYKLAGCGTQTAGLSFGGSFSNGVLTEEYN
jgi:hypothetical protein